MSVIAGADAVFKDSNLPQVFFSCSLKCGRHSRVPTGLSAAGVGEGLSTAKVRKPQRVIAKTMEGLRVEGCRVISVRLAEIPGCDWLNVLRPKPSTVESKQVG